MLSCFKFQKGDFAVQATGVASECAIAANDAVAGHDHGDRVAAHGSGHRARCAGLAHAGAQCPVADGKAMGHTQQGTPYGLLKFGAGGEVQWHIKLGQFAGEIRIQLALRRSGNGMHGMVVAGKVGLVLLPVEPDAEESGIVRGEHQIAPGAVASGDSGRHGDFHETGLWCLKVVRE